jgi:hypothetical protein
MTSEKAKSTSVKNKEGLMTTNSSEWGDSDDGVGQGESKIMILKAGNLKVFFLSLLIR